jgi:hypothetical protein
MRQHFALGKIVPIPYFDRDSTRPTSFLNIHKVDPRLLEVTMGLIVRLDLEGDLAPCWVCDVCEQLLYRKDCFGFLPVKDPQDRSPLRGLHVRCAAGRWNWRWHRRNRRWRRIIRAKRRVSRLHQLECHAITPKIFSKSSTYSNT